MSYIEIVKNEDGITLKLTPAGREELLDHREGDGWDKPTDSILYDLLEDWLCNGWEMVPPEDIGALTSAPILSDEVERDDNGEITKVGAVYWFPDYAVTCELDVLADNGEVFFPAAKSIEDEPALTNCPCPDCGREEENGKWFSPCPSDDCPSHDKETVNG